MDDATANDISDAITLLIGQRKPNYPEERVVRLFRLQSHVYFPDEPGRANTAEVIVGSLLLASYHDRLSKPQQTTPAASPSVLFRQLLQQSNYAAIFDAVFAGTNPIRTLARCIPFGQFQRDLDIRWEHAQAVVDMMDYRYRWLHHQHGKNADARVSRSWVFAINKPNRSRGVTGRTLRTWWSKLKSTAVFLYVFERFCPDMAPNSGPARP